MLPIGKMPRARRATLTRSKEQGAYSEGAVQCAYGLVDTDYVVRTCGDEARCLVKGDSFERCLVVIVDSLM